MAKGNSDLMIWVLIGIVAFAAFGGNDGGASGDGDVNVLNLCSVVEPSASFTGQTMFLAGTTLPAEFVRVLRMNGGVIMRDLGQTSLNSGTLSTTPETTYNLYFGENSSSFYTTKKPYDAPCQDAVDDKVGVICTIDTTPTITVKDEFGNVQSATENAQVIGTSDEEDIEIEIKVTADQCYGNPTAPTGSKNAVCFNYNATVFEDPEVKDSSLITAPFIISNAKTSGIDQVCYGFDILQDTDKVFLTVTLAALTGQDPGTGHNITVLTNDMAFDLDQDDLTEIWDFEDETNNELGAPAATEATIFIS